MKIIASAIVSMASITLMLLLNEYILKIQIPQFHIGCVSGLVYCATFKHYTK